MLFARFFFVMMLVLPAKDSLCQRNINNVDASGKRDGYWFVLYQDKSKPLLFEMAQQQSTYFGRYDKGRKVGVWFENNSDGYLIRRECYDYLQDTLYTETNYYLDNTIRSEGKVIIDRNVIDTLIVINPTTEQEMIKVDYHTVRVAEWKFYYPDGCLRKKKYY